MAHTRRSRPGSGLGVQIKVLKTFQVVVSSLGSGEYSVWGAGSAGHGAPVRPADGQDSQIQILTLVFR